MKAIGFWKSIKVSWTANKGISYLFLLLIPFLVLTSNIAAASTNIDSLKSLIPKLSANKKIDVLQSISKYYLFISSDSCLKYGKQTLLLANELQDVEQEALAYKRMGYACYIVGDYDQGIYFYEKSLSRYMQIKEYLDAAVITNFIGAAYFQKSDYSKAISYYIKTEKCCDTLINISLNQTSVKRLYAILYTNFGLLYYKLDSINKPLEYFNRALYFAETINDSTRISASYSNLGMIYKAQKKFSLALSFYYKSLAISQEIDNQGYEHATLNNIANIYSQKGLIDSALVYFYKAMDIANK